MGIKKKVISEGDMCSFPPKGAMIECHYTLRLKDGTEVDSSVKRGK